MGKQTDYAKLVNESFSALSGIYPMMGKIYQDKTADEISEVKRQWFIGMRDAGLSDADVIRGLSHARRDDNKMPPSLGAFIDMCTFKPERDDSLFMLRRLDKESFLLNVLSRKSTGLNCMEYNTVSEREIEKELFAEREKKNRKRTPEEQKNGLEQLQKMRMMIEGAKHGF